MALIAFDFETTGLMPESDRVLEIGALKLDDNGQVVDSYSTLVNPRRPVAKGAADVNQINPEDLKTAPTMREVLPQLLAFLGDAGENHLLAHNAPFDAAFLAWECQRCQIVPPEFRIYDTLTLSRERLRLRNYRLGTVAETIGIAVGTAHRATDDARTAAAIWHKLVTGKNLSPAELERVQIPFERQTAPDWFPEDERWLHLSRVIRDHIAEGAMTKVQIHYQGEKDSEPQCREIIPIKFKNVGPEGAVIGHCLKDFTDKNFRLDRLSRYDLGVSQRDVG